MRDVLVVGDPAEEGRAFSDMAGWLQSEEQIIGVRNPDIRQD
jgi:hypothetical protein